MLKVQTCQIELLRGLYLFGQQGSFGSVGYRSYLVGLAVPCQQRASAGCYAEVELTELGALYVHILLHYVLRRYRNLLAVIHRSVVVAQLDAYVLLRRCKYLEVHLARLAVLIYVHQQVFRGVLHHAQLAVGQEILHKRLLLIGLKPCEVGLVLGVNARHKLDVRAVGVGQVTVPCASEVAVAPCPLLLSGRDVVVCHVQHSGLCVVLVAALKVILAVNGHVARGHKDVLIVRDVHSCRIVHLVIRARCYRERAYGALSVVEHRVDVWREHALVMVVNCHGRVGPPQERLRHVGAVIHRALYLKIGMSRPQSESCHALLMEHALHLAHPHRHAAVAVVLYGRVNGHVGAGAVMLRPVELDASRNPGACQTHQCRLYHVVVVDKVALAYLVVSHLHASAQFGQNHHLYIFVLNEDNLIFLVGFLVGNRLDHGIWINHSARTLIHSLFKKDRIFLR